MEKEQRRKERERELKATRAAGLYVSNEDLMGRLIALDPDVVVYFDSSRSSTRALCRSHFRFGECVNRRCKWSHHLTIGDLSLPRSRCESVDDLVDDHAPNKNDRRSHTKGGGIRQRATASTELALERHQGVDTKLWPLESKLASGCSDGAFHNLPPALITLVMDYTARWEPAICASSISCRSLRAAALRAPAVDAVKDAALPRLRAERRAFLIRNAARLKFASSRGALAHDHDDAAVWRAFERSAREARPLTEARGGAEAVKDGAAPVLKNVPSVTPSASGQRLELPTAALAQCLLSLLCDKEAGALIASCNHWRAVSRSDPAFRLRKREGLARIPVTKKTNDKKKMSSKKKVDGFARGR